MGTKVCLHMSMIPLSQKIMQKSFLIKMLSESRMTNALKDQRGKVWQRKQSQIIGWARLAMHAWPWAPLTHNKSVYHVHMYRISQYPFLDILYV